MALLTLINVLVVALVIPGLINRTRAILAGRKGVRFFQHIFNVAVTVRKGEVSGHTSTLIFQYAPSVYLASIFTAMLFIPVGCLDPVLHFAGDVVMFAYLLALSRLAIILAALDTGSSFEGMGASREALYGAMIEPALFIIAGTLALVSGNTSFSDMFHLIASGGLSPEMAVVLLLLAYVTVKVFTVECGRIPVDDPRTHLELTMIHEVMILDYSGIDLAMIIVGGWLKGAIFALLAGNILGVFFGTGFLSVAATVLLSCAVGIIIGFIESFAARNKLSRNTTYIVTIVAIAFVLFMVAYLLMQNITIG